MDASVDIPDTAPAGAPRRRRPWVAALLSFMAPGIGHLYAGYPRRGIVVALGAQAAAITGIYLSMIVPGAAPRVLCLLLMPVAVLFVWADAFRLASIPPDGFTPRWYNRWYVYGAIWILAGFFIQPVLFNAVREHVAQAFVMPSPSMEPSLLPGDYVLTAPLRGGRVGRGTVVVALGGDGISRIKRVAAIPGDTIEMRSKTLYIDGKPQKEAYVRHIDPQNDPQDPEMLWQTGFLVARRAGYRPSRDNWGPLVVPPGSYFLLGDDRDNSLDGRYLGFTAREQIYRRPVWIYLSRDGTHGSYRWSRMGRAVE